MSQKIKLILPFLAIAAIFLFSGCGQQKMNKDISPAILQDESSAAPDIMDSDMPEPTGNTDAILDAVSAEANLEKDALAEEEAEALESINDSQETDNFGQSYDENEF